MERWIPTAGSKRFLSSDEKTAGDILGRLIWRLRCGVYSAACACGILRRLDQVLITKYSVAAAL